MSKGNTGFQHPDLSLSSTLSTASGTGCKSWVFQLNPETKCEEFGAENKIINNTHKVSLAKITDQNNVHCFFWPAGCKHTKNLYMKAITENSKFHVQTVKVLMKQKWECGRSFDRAAVGSYCMTFTENCSAVITHPLIHLTLQEPTFSILLRENALKGRWFQGVKNQEGCNHQIKCSSSVRLQWQFCATSSKM